MALSIADQIALDDTLVAPADRLKIGKCNLRLSSDITSKEATLQVVYDVLKLTPFYKAFQVTADAPEIYMQEFWASAYVHNRSVRFKMNNKKHIIGLEQFRDILQICPKVGNKKFVDPPLESEIIIFLASLGHSGDIRKLSDVNVNKLHQPWRSFAAVINKCLCGTPSYDSLRLSQAQILWGMKEVTAVVTGYLAKTEDRTRKQKSSELENISEADLTEAEQLKIVIKRSRQETHSSHASGSGADEGTGVKPGVPDAPEYDSEDDISWKSSDEDQDDEQDQDDDDAEKHDDTDEDDSRISSSDEDDSDNDVEGATVAGAKSGEDATDAKDQENEAVKDSNTNLDGRDKVLTDVEDTHVTLTPVNPDGQQQKPSSVPLDSKQWTVAVQLKYDKIEKSLLL
ncbi:hypothetical protein Tco_0655508 [Tanacetum coccineum]|uniref:Uncharacterized protein n=1 Tax=Tanacetum coccineum TaxID=301880 RepID=A0ABQ4X678_9ASTR